jgi:LPXTG-motif cell wall-anchored protein
MPAARRRVALVALVLAGTMPSTALAQTAGDEQYQDPFGGEAESPPPAQPAPAEPAPAAPAPVPDAPGPATPATGTAMPAAAAPAQLPYTGADAGMVALAGGLLLAGGVTLRVRLRERA